MSRSEVKAGRLLQIEALLLAHPEGMTQAEIARRMGVNRSTIHRDLTDLPRHIYIEDDGRLRIDREGYLVNVRVSLHEALALHLAARLLATRMDRQNPHAGAALRKLGAALERLAPRVSLHLKQSADVMDDAAQRHDPVYLQALEKLTLAWAEQRKARVWHRHERTGEVHAYTFAPYFIEPYAVGQSTHAIGWREPPGALRTFKVERIERVELLREAYELPADFDPRSLLAEAWGIWYTESEPVEVVLKFQRRVARRVSETRWHRSERIEELEDGSLIWRARVAEPQEMLPWIRGWGADVEVVEPAALREMLRREARHLAELYKIELATQAEKQYYAHSKDRIDESEWQLLKDHLRATGNLAFELGREAGVSELAQLAGYLHDIGKYSQLFQERLRGSKRTVDHATAGAREVIRLFPGNPLAELLSYCIAGHHSGLPDYGDPTDLPGASTLLARREKKPLEDYSAYRTEIVPGALALPGLPLKPSPGHAGFTVSFLTRMIYSTLVDADWMETETYMEGGPKPRGDHAPLGVLLERFNAYLKRFEGLPGAVNQKRSETLQACVAAAGAKPGLFTLTVPTGGGKTLASLAFALNHAVQHGMKRIIYVIPFTTIIEQNAAIFKEALGEENVLEHHSNFDWEGLKQREIPANTDDETNQVFAKLKLASENWDVPVVVTTNVQFFESLFANKKSRARKVHNLAKSVIIFDEAQMLPREYLKPCMLAVWELTQNYSASAVFCTATQPILKSFFPDSEISELAPKPQELFDFYRRVEIHASGKLTDAELAQRLNGHTQVLCVVNTRRHAKGLFDLLEEEGRFHLSTLMCPVHRQETLHTIRQRLQGKVVCRVVSTQVIEAGVDVDFPAGYRALAGLDSIVQAAGRVNRERRNPSGEVVVFEPETDLIKRVPAFIAQTSRAGESVLRDYANDPTSEEAIRAYFRLLDSLQDPKRSTDVKNILAYLDKENGKFEFAKAGENFRLIESPTVGVIVPYDENARDLLERLRYSAYPARLLRLLQRYTVSIYEREFEALQMKGAIETYHDQYHVLNEMAYYDNQTGLALLTERGGEAIFFD
ncbi:MAG: CRISPR-associated helicase Cas3' [Chloroflexota bacterium]